MRFNARGGSLHGSKSLRPPAYAHWVFQTVPDAASGPQQSLFCRQLMSDFGATTDITCPASTVLSTSGQGPSLFRDGRVFVDGAQRGDLEYLFGMPWYFGPCLLAPIPALAVNKSLLVNILSECLCRIEPLL